MARSESVREWLESPYLLRIASRVAYEYGLPPQDIDDLFQELCLALWIAGPATLVNTTWVFHTANHKAVDALARNRRTRLAGKGEALLRDAPKGDDLELSHLLHSRMTRLPERLRRFYLLRYREGLSQRETGQRMGLCRSSVRWLERQCLRSVKGRLPCVDVGSDCGSGCPEPSRARTKSPPGGQKGLAPDT